MKNSIVLAFVGILFSSSIYAQDRIVLDTANVKQRKTVIFMRQDSSGQIYYQDINGRTAIPQGQSFVINIAPGLTYSASSKKVTLISELPEQPHKPNNHSSINNQYTYDNKTDPQIGIGYFLGNIVGRNR